MQIYVAGVGMTQFGRQLDKAVWQMGEEALNKALDDAGAHRSDIEMAFYSGQTQGFLQGQYAAPGQMVFARTGVTGIPVYNVENACAGGTSGFQMAKMAIEAGQCDIALALGVEKMNIEDKSKALALFDGGWDVSRIEENYTRLIALGEGIEVPEGSESDRPYSKFMQIYAAMCRFWMKEFGTTQRQIAAVSAKNHMHSVHNPLSQFRKPFTIEEVLADHPITYPLTRPMCAPLSDGGAAVIVCNEKGLTRLNGNKDRAIRVRGAAIATASERGATEFDKAVCRRAADKAYDMAGLGPQDVDVAEVHDASAMGEVLAVEYTRLMPMGEAGPAAERGDLSIGGKIPVNPSGGLESKGHPLGATGLGQIHELVTQLRGEAGPRQVEDAKIALQENGGASVGYEEAVVAVNLFSR